MSESPKRWNPTGVKPIMETWANGDYVLYTDYANLEAERERLLAEVQDLKAWREECLKRDQNIVALIDRVASLLTSQSALVEVVEDIMDWGYRKIRPMRRPKEFLDIYGDAYKALASLKSGSVGDPIREAEIRGAEWAYKHVREEMHIEDNQLYGSFDATAIVRAHREEKS